MSYTYNPVERPPHQHRFPKHRTSHPNRGNDDFTSIETFLKGMDGRSDNYLQRLLIDNSGNWVPQFVSCRFFHFHP